MTKSVLVIEKQLAVRRMLRFALELQAFDVVELEDAAAALDKLADRGAALLIVGIDPVNADGMALVDEVRRRPDLEHLPILLVGEAHLRDRWKTGAIGNCFWLSRPFRLGELHDLVEGLLGPRPWSGQRYQQRN